MEDRSAPTATIPLGNRRLTLLRQVNVELAETHFNHGLLGHVIEIANLALATRALYDTLSEPDSVVGFDSKSAAFLNLVGSALDAVSAFKAFHKLGEWGLRRVAIFSAMIDIYLAGRDAVDAAERGDTAGVVGSSLVGVGTALTLVGTCASASAALAAAGSAGGAAAGGVAVGGVAGGAAAGGAAFGAAIAGFAGAILVGAGYIVLYANQPPPPLKTFIQHCRFGERYGKAKAGDSQPWSAGEFKAWKSGLDGDRAQVVALHNLILCFGIQGLDLGQKANLLDGGFRIYHPPLNSCSIIYLDYDAQYTLLDRGFRGITKRLGGQCRIRMNASKRQSRIVLSNDEGHFDETGAVSYGRDDAYVSVIDVVLHPKVLTKNDIPLRLWNLSLTVLIDVNGDNTLLVPSPESMSVKVWEDGAAVKAMGYSTGTS